MKKTILILLIGLFVFLPSCESKPKESKIVSESKAKNITVYLTKTGECYHQEECSCLRKSKIERTLSDIAHKYRPCQLCYPPIIEEE